VARWSKDARNGNADSNGTAPQMLNWMNSRDKADIQTALRNEAGNRHSGGGLGYPRKYLRA
jgi:hypothetical protein